MYLLCVIILGLVGGISAQGCADCYRLHPQQMFCDSDFVLRVVVTSTAFNVKIPHYDDMSYNLMRADVVKNLKPGLVWINDNMVEFYSPTSFCGNWFDLNTEYLVTGNIIESKNGTKHLLHGHCSLSEEWEELSSKQQKGFDFKYGRMCTCQILGVKSDLTLRVTDMETRPGYERAQSYWMPDNCYYNPLKSERYHREDCEDEFGFCKPERDGTCEWQMSPDYESCFSERETFVLALEGSQAITDISQCKVLRNRRQRRRCKKRVKHNIRNLQMEATVETEQ